MPKISPNTKRALLAIALSAALAGCGSNASNFTSSTASSTADSTSTSAPASTVTASAHAVTVSISGYAYHPVTLSVTTGTRVTFTNHDQTAHTATASNSGFDTGTVNPGKSAAVTFTKPGTYTYICQFHAFMHGSVIVR